VKAEGKRERERERGISSPAIHQLSPPPFEPLYETSQLAMMQSAQTRRVRGVSVYRPIIYGNSTTLLSEPERQGTDHTHRWTVGIRSAASLARLNSHPNHQIGGADDLR
jgi:hypothetical protein